MIKIDDLLYRCLKNADYKVFKIQAPQNQQMPYAVFYVVADTKSNTACGQDTSYEDVRFTINVYDNNLQSVQDMRDEILTKLNNCKDFSCIPYQTLEDMPDNIAYRSIIDFKLNRVMI